MAEPTFLQKLTAVRDTQVTDPKTGKTGNLLTDKEFERFKKDQASKNAKKRKRAEEFVDALFECKRNFETLDKNGKRLLSEKELIVQKNKLISNYGKTGVLGFFRTKKGMLVAGGLVAATAIFAPMGSSKKDKSGTIPPETKRVIKTVEAVTDYVGQFNARIAGYDSQDRAAFRDARSAIYILLGGYAKDNPAEIERFLNDKIKDESIRNMTIQCIHHRKIKTIENQADREKATDQIMDDVLKTFDDFYSQASNTKPNNVQRTAGTTLPQPDMRLAAINKSRGGMGS